MQILMLCLISIPFFGFSQEKYRSQVSDIEIAGTSSIHDWEMKSDKAQFDATFILKDDKLASISALSFSVPAESLKSGHGGMDNNAYKALKTTDHKNISFVLSSVQVIPVDATTYQLKCRGKLTISGTTHETDLLVNCKWNVAEKSFNCTGSKKIKMTDYNVKPPVIMMGAIKTGNDITINYNLKVHKA
jgi:polyisoprenoid-binding protein YceI